MSNKKIQFALRTLLVCAVSLLVVHADWADTKTQKDPPKIAAPTPVYVEAVEVDELVKSDLADIKKDCPTCTFLTGTGFLLNPGGTHQETAVVYVWHPGKDVFFVHSKHLIYNVVFIFLPAGDKETKLKEFLAKPLEVK